MGAGRRGRDPQGWRQPDLRDAQQEHAGQGRSWHRPQPEQDPLPAEAQVHAREHANLRRTPVLSECKRESGREQWRKRKAAGKIPLTADLSPEEQERKRTYYREYRRRRRAEQKRLRENVSEMS